jgi:peroxiredoxin
MALLLDPNGEVGRAYGAKVTPQMIVIDPQGTVIYNGAIDDKRSANAADVAGARNHVAAALDEARAGKPVSVASTAPYGCTVKYKP